MIIIIKKPDILCGDDGNFKSMTYFNNKLKSGFTDLNDFINLPIILGLCAIISFYIAKYIVINDTNK
jgi:hypothetical protein